MRRIAVVTTSRADFGIYRPILRALLADEELEPQVVVSGSHLVEEHGMTVHEVEQEVPVAATVPVLDGDEPLDIARAMGRGVSGFAEAFAGLAPDVVLVLGDRFEMHAAALAAMPLRLPVAHIHGGELTFGSFDDQLRHSMTKLSHLHFVTTPRYRERILQLGEEPWRVVVSGAPALDNLRSAALAADDALEALGLTPGSMPVVVAFHPPTLEGGAIEPKIAVLLAALDAVDAPVVLTASNADPGGSTIRAAFVAHAEAREHVTFVPNLGTDSFLAVCSAALAIVGNSSAALIEAPSLGLPAVNVGTRQGGRVRGTNVIDVGYDVEEIRAALRRAADPTFRATVQAAPNPYDAGGAATIILEHLRGVELGMGLLMKRFVDR